MGVNLSNSKNTESKILDQIKYKIIINAVCYKDYIINKNINRTALVNELKKKTVFDGLKINVNDKGENIVYYYIYKNKFYIGITKRMNNRIFESHKNKSNFSYSDCDKKQLYAGFIVCGVSRDFAERLETFMIRSFDSSLIYNRTVSESKSFNMHFINNTLTFKFNDTIKR